MFCSFICGEAKNSLDVFGIEHFTFTLVQIQQNVVKYARGHCV